MMDLSGSGHLSPPLMFWSGVTVLNVSLLIPLVSNGDVRADRNGASLTESPASIFWEISCLVVDEIYSESEVYKEPV